MKLYHGTSEEVADELCASPERVSVEVGGGELGRGFYAGDHLALAASWARGRYPGRAGVLEIDVDTVGYLGLAIKVMGWHEVVATWNELTAKKQKRTFLFGVDVVHGPLATRPSATQHKFESEAAGSVLRSSKWRRI